MMRRFLIAGVALTAFLGVFETAEGHTHAYRTKVDASYDFSKNEVTGDISSVGFCEGRRKVRVYHISGATGARTLAATTKSEANGDWVAHPSIVPTIGDEWEIVVKGKRIRSPGHRHTCRRGHLNIPA